MIERSDTLEKIWNNLLSQHDERVKAAYSGLSPDERYAVMKHLIRMKEEEGWLENQRQSANIALEVIKELDEY